MITKEFIKKLNQYVEDGLITKRKHPEFPIYIYNYSPEVQYSRLWDEVTMNCRGLILDEYYNVLARPFPKFFNYEEVLDKIPNLPFEVYTKLDGSLGILYWWNNEPYIATRGSFESEQAIWATKFFREKYDYIRYKFRRDYTYLFEILYPENRIVVDYRDWEALVLLSVVDKSTGIDSLDFEEIKGILPIVKRWNGYEKEQNIKFLKELNEKNAEGFVLKFSNGFRVKVKFENYIKIHRIISRLTPDSIYKDYISNLKNEEEFNNLINNIKLQDIPDECFEAYSKIVYDFKDKFLEIKNFVNNNYKEFPTRKEFAEYVLGLNKNLSGLFFNRNDGKNWEEKIFKYIN